MIHASTQQTSTFQPVSLSVSAVADCHLAAQGLESIVRVLTLDMQQQLLQHMGHAALPLDSEVRQGQLAAAATLTTVIQTHLNTLHSFNSEVLERELGFYQVSKPDHTPDTVPALQAALSQATLYLQEHLESWSDSPARELLLGRVIQWQVLINRWQRQTPDVIDMVLIKTDMQQLVQQLTRTKLSLPQLTALPGLLVPVMTYTLRLETLVQHLEKPR